MAPLVGHVAPVWSRASARPGLVSASPTDMPTLFLFSNVARFTPQARHMAATLGQEAPVWSTAGSRLRRACEMSAPDLTRARYAPALTPCAVHMAATVGKPLPFPSETVRADAASSASRTPDPPASAAA